MSRDNCHFAVEGKRCLVLKEGASPFCTEHAVFFAPISNRELIERAASSMRESLYVNREKKLSCKVDAEVWGNFNNYLNELSARGYNSQDAMAAISCVLQEKGMLDDLYKQMGLDPKWKKFEKIVAGIHVLGAEGAEVKFDDRITGRRTGRERQVDVSIRFRQTFYDYLAIVECKDYDSRVPIDKVEAFRTKMEDVGTTKGIMVSPKGFQKGSVKTAEAYNIELFTLTEVRSDWTKTIRAQLMNMPLPTNIEFDHPCFDVPAEGHRVQFEDIVFYQDQHSPPVPLNRVLADVCAWAFEEEIAFPCLVEVPFEPPFLTRFPGTNFYTPVYSIAVTLEPSRVALGREIDMPPKLVKYVYSDVAKGRAHEFPAGKVPSFS